MIGQSVFPHVGRLETAIARSHTGGESDLSGSDVRSSLYFVVLAVVVARWLSLEGLDSGDFGIGPAALVARAHGIGREASRIGQCRACRFTDFDGPAVWLGG